MKTHCRRGHPFTPENTLITKSYAKVCKTCKRRRERDYRRWQRDNDIPPTLEESNERHVAALQAYYERLVA